MNECCVSLLQENLKLKKLVEKEQQRRRYVMTAYRKLLSAYQAVVDFRE